MAEKGKSTLDMNTVIESPPVSNGVHGSAEVAPPSQPHQKAVNAGGSGSASGELVKKRRGRPRKFDAAGNLLVSPESSVASPPVMSAVASPPLMSAVASMPVPSVIASPPVMSAVASVPVSQVVSETPPGITLSHSADNSGNRTQGRGRGRGRPPGTGHWQLLASQGGLFSDTAAGDFRACVIDVCAGEDVIGKVMSLTQEGPRGLCILSANGTVSSVTIRQPGSSGGVITYGGQFEILSLTGSFTISDIGGVKSWTGDFSVSLAGPDGRVIGGGVAGPLVAANPIQTVVGTFKPDAYKIHKRKQQYEARMVSPIQSVPDAAPVLQATGETNASPFQVQNHVGADTSINRAGPYYADRNSPEEPEEQKPSPDINMAKP